MSTDLDGGNAVEMSTVIGRYKEYLNEQQMSLNSYTTQRLKLRLNKHFGDKIVFHQPYDRTKSELLYSTAISLQDVINSAYKCNAAAIERVSCEQPSFEMADCDRVKLLYHAAQLIKSDITDASVPQWRNFQYGACQYAAVPTWRCSSVSQFRRHVSMAHAFCLDNNLFINDLQTESTATVSTVDVL